MSDRALDTTRARQLANASIVVAIALLVVMLLYSLWPQKDPNTQGSSPPPLPRLTMAERRSAGEALQTLKGLQSVTTAGVTYQEYLRRVLDAKVQVDRYLQTEGGDTASKKSIQEAMGLYVLASSAWNAKITDSRDRSLAEDPAIDLCPPVKKRRDEARGASESSSLQVYVVSVNFQYLWRCASERIENLDRALKER